MLKIVIAWIEMLIMLHTYIPSILSSPQPSYEATYQNLGTPLLENYPDDPFSRSPWDMIVYDDKLFVGGGDYDKNTGPVPVYYYDLNTEQWINSGSINDEQIEHFKVIQNTLMIPGCDPRDDWEYGNIYQYQDSQWFKNRSIPGGIHQFDLVEYEGMIFVALGVSAGEYPAAVSKDQGTTFEQIPFFKNGLPLDTAMKDNPEINTISNRVYDFFLLNGELYAYYCCITNLNSYLEIYQYRDEGFHYYCDLPENITTRRTSYRTFNTKVEYDGKLYYTTGNLYVTTDLNRAERIILTDKCAVTDINIIDNKLYTVTTEKNENGTYRNALWKYNNTRESFYEVFYFTSNCPVLSFSYANDVFYFGTGHGVLESECTQCGSILSVNYP